MTASSREGGDDLVTGGAGDDTLVGGAGNDMFVAGIGDGNDSYFGDELNGGTGVDTLDMSAITAAATVDLGTGVLGHGSAFSSQTGTDTLWGVENVVTGSGADSITASEALNVMDGGAGNDTFHFLSVRGRERRHDPRLRARRQARPERDRRQCRDRGQPGVRAHHRADSRRRRS